MSPKIKLLNSIVPRLITGGDPEEREKEIEKIIGIKISSTIPDFFLLDSETSIGIGEVRNLQNSIKLKPFSSSKIHVFIKEAQNLTVEAQNALLKTLEEPPGHCLIFLTAPDSSWLLPTVVSRCQITNLSSKIKELPKEEFEKQKKLLEKLISSSIPQRFVLLEEEGIAKDRETATFWIDEMIIVARKLMIGSINRTYLKILQDLNQSKIYLKANSNVRLTLENFLLDLTSEN